MAKKNKPSQKQKQKTPPTPDEPVAFSGGGGDIEEFSNRWNRRIGRRVGGV